MIISWSKTSLRTVTSADWLMTFPASVIVGQFILASCWRVPNQTNWVLSASILSRFDDILSPISVTHGAKKGVRFRYRWAFSRNLTCASSVYECDERDHGELRFRWHQLNTRGLGSGRVHCPAACHIASRTAFIGFLTALSLYRLQWYYWARC